MQLNRLDLNLLLIFDALMRTRSVTLAGERVGLSQSATSNSLQRLREAFGDKLFVRTPAGMQPTALALELEDDVSAALERLRAAFERNRAFDPASARRTFRILLSDIAQQAHLPTFVALLRQEAPNVDLVGESLPVREARDAMVQGELDLAVGFLPDLGAEFHRQSLFVEHWVCVINRDHPSIGGTLTREQYLAAAHLSYRPAASIHASLDQLLEAEFAGQGVRRRIALSASYSSGLAATLAMSDLVLTAPSGPASFMIRDQPLRIVPLPFELPTIDLNMQWHARMHGDPGNRWFRQRFAANYCAGS
ncbi:HTH-type transcriptional regulator SyrM 1 [Pigmentiphaga humi]|uniref:HTH-type transcriptional regulator SyrM 1 n=1 Tax=Pigmentiphaga humi TaxID=2478468 RepID=A0A3P4B018_9BURK|nr:LysR family transcriptional regulator [Pigmentiphaga humi]VCU69644.1 HTH-type transcriptional regulator SyrM 1 [Pigmentiphaga humi]